MGPACADEPVYRDSEGQQFCILHWPSDDKRDDFVALLRKRLSERSFDFRGVWFPAGTSFRGVLFDRKALFGNAHFAGVVDFSDAYFSEGAHFKEARFAGDAIFASTRFRTFGPSSKDEGGILSAKTGDLSEVNFESVRFDKRADFSRVQCYLDTFIIRGSTFYGEADFSAAIINPTHMSGRTDFHAACFRQRVSFEEAKFDSADFSETRFDGVADFRSAEIGSDRAPETFQNTSFADRADFSHTVFNYYRPQFSDTRFSGPAVFTNTVFRKGADFAGVRFEGSTDFRAAQFKERTSFALTPSDGVSAAEETRFWRRASFEAAVFDAAVDFQGVIFGDAVSFEGTEFGGDVDFGRMMVARGAAFTGARFSAYARFGHEGGASSPQPALVLRLEHALVKRPELMSFHALQLRPHWFVHVDPRKFEFIGIDWGRVSVGEAIALLKETGETSPHKSLSIAYRGLAINAAENDRFEEASRFRFLALEARRRESWAGLAPWRLEWWYWLASGYGERMTRAFFVLMGIWLLSAALYMCVGFVRWEPAATSRAEFETRPRDHIGEPLKMSRALVHSLAVMTLQKPEPRPATTSAQVIVLLETVLAPVQAALLALAIRRRFMR